MVEFKIGFHHGQRGQIEWEHPVYIHPTVYIDNTGDVHIGKGVSISRNVRIYTHDHYHDEKTIEEDVKSNRMKRKGLVIGDDVYIGDGAIILSGVGDIGQGAVIGAGSVITKRVADYAVVAGNPAVKIKKRSV